MSKHFRCASAFVICLLLALPAMAADGINGNLVTAQWLQQNLKNPGIVLLDASPAPVYAAKHIAGAIHYDIFTYGVQDMPADEMEKRYQSWGIRSGTKVVFYDQGGTFLATRALFSLDYYGFPNQDLFVLDGGLAKWQELGLPVTAEATPPPAKGNFTVKALNKNVKADTPEVLAASGDTAHNALVEALDPAWHYGEMLVMPRPGHIPRAILAPSADFFNPDKTFKSPDEIRTMVTYLGIRPDQTVYSHCGGGIAASVPYFALKFILRYPHVKLYPGSELEWLSDERELPYWTYDAPYLLRDTQWLQFSTGRMPRMYGVTHVSIVDVRPAEAFGQGHIPFALNVPAGWFRDHIAAPEQMAALLGPAGVNPAEEAVVISGAGVTRDAALAFLLFDQLGQKVSIFTDSLEKWARSGYQLPKEPTAVGPKKSPNDVSIVPAVYHPTTRAAAIISDPKATRGAYPKIFLASGKDMPAKLPDGKVVHVAYSDLLNADGTPKAAKDIWNILAKAGVSRYAELVCFSDDPGEAAANYFVLKLMGFPDVKVLIGN